MTWETVATRIADLCIMIGVPAPEIGEKQETAMPKVEAALNMALRKAYHSSQELNRIYGHDCRSCHLVLRHQGMAIPGGAVGTGAYCIGDALGPTNPDDPNCKTQRGWPLIAKVGRLACCPLFALERKIRQEAPSDQSV